MSLSDLSDSEAVNLVAEMPFTLTEAEQVEVDRILAELNAHGYQKIEMHVSRGGIELKPGTRIRHGGHQWDDALFKGTGHVVAITEKPDSAWSGSWGMPDVELIAVFDKAWPLDSRLAQLAQYHVAVVNNAPGEDDPAAKRFGIVRCCDLHGINCEPPSELCCQHCTEANHPDHPNTDCVLRSGDTGSNPSGGAR